MVDLDLLIELVEKRRAGVDVVIEGVALVVRQHRQGVQIGKIGLVDSVRGNLIALKGHSSRTGIVKRLRVRTSRWESTGAHQSRRCRAIDHGRLLLLRPLLVEVEKRLLPVGIVVVRNEDGTAKVPPEYIPLLRRDGRAKEVTSVQGSVAQEFPGASMERAGAALGLHNYDAGSHQTVLGVVIILQNLDLFNFVRIRNDGGLRHVAGILVTDSSHGVEHSAPCLSIDICADGWI